MIAATMICKGCQKDIDKAFNVRDYSDLQVCQDCLDLANCCRDTCDDDDKGIAGGDPNVLMLLKCMWSQHYFETFMHGSTVAKLQTTST